jgi:hypothetical protein
MKRRALFAILAALPACTQPDERVTVEMIWIEPPKSHPSTPIVHEPDVVYLAFADTPNYHIFFPSAPILAMLRAKANRNVQATFYVTRGRFSSKVLGYSLISVEGIPFDPTTPGVAGSGRYGNGFDPPPFTE